MNEKNEKERGSEASKNNQRGKNIKERKKLWSGNEVWRKKG